ncbi:MAG: 5'-methylthioadenosine/adenosylhomocysteine nucleosidase, partial [Muribaculaceae bacterium]|nr:5'-methylthioadenosine/adenosylhomocysteine nucleosidase [Muribaculaceae bacterium]
IIVAMDKELALLKPLLSDRQKESDGDIDFITGRIGDRDVVVMKSGIGKVNAALAASAMINRYHPAIVINSGVAGGTGHGAKILDVVVGSRVAYHDVWCGPGTKWGQAAGCPEFFECPSFIRQLPCLKHPDIVHGLICSGDIFVSDKEVLDRIRHHFPEVDAVDMESAAIAQTCFMANVPFVAVRVISDTPGAADNISQYENFWDDAPRRTFHILEQIVAEI